MDGTLDLLRRAWAGEPVTGDDFPVGPPPTRGNRVPVLMGGTSDAAIRRTVTHAEGWTAPGGGPDMDAPVIEKVRRAWADAGREGEPRIGAVVYFGLGDDEASRASLRIFYGFLGDWTETVVEAALRTPKDVADIARRYADLGVTDLAFVPLGRVAGRDRPVGGRRSVGAVAAFGYRGRGCTSARRPRPRSAVVQVAI